MRGRDAKGRSRVYELWISRSRFFRRFYTKSKKRDTASGGFYAKFRCFIIHTIFTYRSQGKSTTIALFFLLSFKVDSKENKKKTKKCYTFIRLNNKELAPSSSRTVSVTTTSTSISSAFDALNRPLYSILFLHQDNDRESIIVCLAGPTNAQRAKSF